MKKSCFHLILAIALAGGNLMAEDNASILKKENRWQLRNDVVDMSLVFAKGSIDLASFRNIKAAVDYVEPDNKGHLFSHVCNDSLVRADDGGWVLEGDEISDIELYGKRWGKRLEIRLARKAPVNMNVRLFFELYHGSAGIRCGSFVKNNEDKEVRISASDVIAPNFANKPHKLHYIEGRLNWKETDAGISYGGRNCIARYDSGDGWFIVPENNWATCLEPGPNKGDENHKLTYIQAWDGNHVVRVATDPLAVQLILFPSEEVEYFSVNLGGAFNFPLI